MNTHNNEKFEKALSEALELQEKGRSTPEILNLLPEFKEELGELFRVIEVLYREKENIVPQKEILTNIISRISTNEDVTNKETERYLYRGEVKGRPSIPEEVISKTESMFTKWKILLPIGVAAVIVLAVITTQFTGRITGRKSTSFSLNEIVKEQENFNDLGAEINQYASEEIALGEVDSALEEAATDVAAPATQAPSAPSAARQDPFGLASIQTESKAVGFDSELNSFFSEETSLKEVDSALSDF